MATVAELEARQAELKAEEQRLRVEYDAFEAKKSAVLDQQRPLDRELRAQRAIITDPNASEAEKDAAVLRGTEIEQELRTISAEFRSINDQQTSFLNNTLRPVQDELFNPITGIGAQIEDAKREEQTAAKAAADQGPQTNSTGTTVTLAQAARDDGANTQNPQPLPVTSTAATAESGISNAERFPPKTNEGTDDPVRSSVSTQSVPPPTASQPINNETESQNDIFTASNTAGVGAASDDSATTAGGGNTPQGSPATTPDSTSSGSNAVVTLANNTARPIIPQPNILDRLSSYTYTVSIYLMSPEDYQRLLTTGKKFISGYQLLMQSAGAATGVAGVVDPNVSVDDFAAAALEADKSRGRNQFFPLDYYIDELEVKSIINGKGTGAAHNVAELKFKIIEPNGITLLNNLYDATEQYVNRGGGASRTTVSGNYAAQNYLMVIRFYGYDSQGNSVTTTAAPDSDGRSDSRALVEKFIPFQFTAIKFRVANRLTEYQCEAICPQNVIATAQGRGVIPYNIEITATTLQNLFNGNISYVKPGATTAPDKATAAPNPTLATGLTQALNEFQTEQVTNGTYDIADKYKIIISHPEIANASIVPPGPVNKLNTPMVDPTSAAQAKDGDKQVMQTNAKTFSAHAGMSIVQFLEMAVRSSDYIFKQQTKIKTTDRTGKEVDIPTGNAGQAFAWYRIGVESKPIGSVQDPKRNDYAYEITYEIAPYGINDIKSEYFPKGRFRGAQKQYNYWFTGENTSVLNFEQDFNYLYYVVVNSRQNPKATSDYRQTEYYHEKEKRVFSTASGASAQGTSGPEIEPSANAADYLYSPGDQGQLKITIVGDPAWIQQGEIWKGIRSARATEPDNTDVYFDAFLKDGTINFDAREALFELTFNKPADYNLQTGVMKVTGPNVTTQTYIYKATTVTSNFRQGKFTQDLEGVLLIFPDATAASAAVSPTIATSDGASTDNENNQSAAETARLDRLNAAAAESKLKTVNPVTSAVTGTQPSSSEVRSVTQILTPVTPPSLTDNQLVGTPAYIQARLGGASAQTALDIARAATTSGTNNYSGAALPGIRTDANTGIVKDDNGG